MPSPIGPIPQLPRLPRPPLSKHLALLLALALNLIIIISPSQFAHARTLAPFPPPRLATCHDDVADISPDETRTLHHHLQTLVSTSTFFSVFSVALENPCPFWSNDDEKCFLRDCSVESCADDQIPPVWRSPCPSPGQQSKPKQKRKRNGNQKELSFLNRHHAANHLNVVDRSLTGLAALVGPPPCPATDSTAWVPRDDDDDCIFVDLRRNPERYTGYSGPSARRIWEAIYSENCFTFSAKCSSGICDRDSCKEERVLYRLISGLHASINMHIAMQYLTPGDVWLPNLDIYQQRVRPYPGRIANLKVAYAVVLRAVAKAGPALHPRSYTYITGNDTNDRFTHNAITHLLEQPILNPDCHDQVFDESDMFLRDNQHLLPEFRNAFRNISMIMDCVGCEKCRLWGKLQFLGLGTAMRILFETKLPELQRNDVIALINLLYKLSSSVLAVERMEKQIQTSALVRTAGIIVLITLVLSTIAGVLRLASTKAMDPLSSASASENASQARPQAPPTPTDEKISERSASMKRARPRKRNIARAD